MAVSQAKVASLLSDHPLTLHPTPPQPTRSSTHGSSALSNVFKTGSLHGHHNDDRPSSSSSSAAATGPLPKHPTNKKPYPHSPSGSLPSLHGDTIQLTYDSVDIERAAKEVQSKWAGATVCFLGSTREDWAHPDTAASTSSAPPTLRVTRLEYECYTPLALKTMRAILQRARETPSTAWPPADLSSRDIAKIDEAVEAELTAKDMAAGEPAGTSGNAISRAGTSSSSKKDSRRGSAQQTPPSSPQDAVLRIHLSHRLGPVPVGQPSILLAVSSPHRRRAFEVAEWILEEVKRIVPVWKREVREALDEESTSGGKKKGSSKKGDGHNDEEGMSEWVGLDDKAKSTALAGPAAAFNGNATTNNGAAEASNGATEAKAGQANQASSTLGGGGDDLSKVTTKDEVFQDAALAPSMSRVE